MAAVDLAHPQRVVRLLDLQKFPGLGAALDGLGEPILALQAGLRSRKSIRSLGARNAEHSVTVREDEIAGIDDDSVTRDRHVDRLVRPPLGADRRTAVAQTGKRSSSNASVSRMLP
jgi:hypothetical protein